MLEFKVRTKYFFLHKTLHDQHIDNKISCKTISFNSYMTCLMKGALTCRV